MRTARVLTTETHAHQHSDIIDRMHDPFAIRHYLAEATKYEQQRDEIVERSYDSDEAMDNTDPREVATLDLLAKVARLCVLAFETKDTKEIGCALTLRSEVNKYADEMSKHRAKEAKQ